MERGRARRLLVNASSNEEYIVEARFPAGTFTGPGPKWQTALERKDRDSRRGLQGGAGAGLLLLALAGVWMFRIRVGAGNSAAGNWPPNSITAPPNLMAPAVAGWLVGKARLSLGTLLDLARRGVLRIEGTRGRLMGRQFQVVRCDGSAGLAPHERFLVERVFRDGETTVSLRSFFSRTSGMKFASAVRREAQEAGLVDQTRVRVQRTLLVVGGAGIAAGVALVLMGMAWGTSAELALVGAGAMAVGVAVAAAGVLGLILGAIQSVRSETGEVAAAEWKAFAGYLREAASGRAALPGAEEWEKVLPYAATFGVVTSLLKWQKKGGGVALPAWFHATGEDGEDLDAYEAFLVTSDYSGSGSGGGGGDGGGGGASGGGASGAG